MSNADHLLTPKHFKIFRRAVTKWIKQCQLESWHTRIQFQGINGMISPDALADVEYDYQIQDAVISLNQNWKTVAFTNEKADMTALHEYLHLVFAPLMELFEPQSALERVAINEEHRTIATLEKIIFHKVRKD